VLPKNEDGKEELGEFATHRKMNRVVEAYD